MRLTRLLLRGNGLDDLETVPPDRLVDLDILVGDLGRAPARPQQRRSEARRGCSVLIISSSAHLRLIAVGRVTTSVS